MAIFSLNIAKISKSTGASAVNSSAYIHRERYKSDFYEKTFNYSGYKKDDEIYSEILLCKNAPAEFIAPEKLWNSVEKIEKQSNALLARRIIVALPKELDKQGQIDLIKEYATDNFTSQGMCVDFAIHFEKGNPHAHILLTTRPIKENGEWGKKEKKVLALDENGNKIPVIDKETGEQKVRARKGKGVEKLWERKLVNCFSVNHTNMAEEWRENWAKACNGRLKPLDVQIDHRSYERQGLEIEPTIHEGYSPLRQIINVSVKKIRNLKRSLSEDIKSLKTEIRASKQLRDEKCLSDFYDDYVEYYVKYGFLLKSTVLEKIDDNHIVNRFEVNGTEIDVHYLLNSGEATIMCGNSKKSLPAEFCLLYRGELRKELLSSDTWQRLKELRYDLNKDAAAASEKKNTIKISKDYSEYDYPESSQDLENWDFEL